MRFVDRNLLNGAGRELQLPVFLGVLVIFGIILAYRLVGFSVQVGDVASYVNWSHNLSRSPAYGYHLPGYPALILLGRWMAMGWLADSGVAQGLCLLAWLVSLILARGILQTLAPQTQDFGLLLFALFPVVGVSLVAFPIADMVAYAFFWGSVWCAVRQRWGLFVLNTSLGLLMHQAFYPFYLCLALVCVFTMGMRFTQLLISGFPLMAYWISILLTGGRFSLGLNHHSMRHLSSQSDLPILDGVLGTLLRFTLKDLVKGTMLLAIVTVALVLSIQSLKGRKWLNLALVAPLLIFGFLSNQDISFVIIRLAKVLIIPTCVWLAGWPRASAMIQTRTVYCTLALFLILSQFVFAAYLVKS